MKEFLNDIFQSDWKVQELKGDSGERTYFRVLSSQGNYIFVEHVLQNTNFKNFREIQNILYRNHINVPQIKALDESKQFLLLEDVGDFNLEQFYFETKSLEEHCRSLNLLFKFQNLNPKNFKEKFTDVQGIREMILAYQDIKKHVSYSDKESLFKEFRDINLQIMKGYLVPGHRDFHSRNIFINRNHIYLIDFQDAGLYPQYYDLVSLVYDSYVGFSKKEQEQLLQYYEQKWSQNLNRDLLFLTFCQRTLKAIGSFVKFYHQRRQTTHLKYVRPCLEELQRQLTEMKCYPYFLNYTQFLLEDK